MENTTFIKTIPSRLLSTILLVALLSVSCLGIISASAASLDAKLTLTSVVGKPGEDVSVELILANDPGICSLVVSVNYDKGLTLKAVTDSGKFVNPIFSGSFNTYPFGLSWDDSANRKQTPKNGTLATLTFTVDKNAAPGDYDVWLTYDQNNIYNVDYGNIECQTVAGKVTVKSPVVVTPSEITPTVVTPSRTTLPIVTTSKITPTIVTPSETMPPIVTPSETIPPVVSPSETMSPVVTPSASTGVSASPEKSSTSSSMTSSRVSHVSPPSGSVTLSSAPNVERESDSLIWIIFIIVAIVLSAIVLVFIISKKRKSVNPGTRHN